MYLCIVSLHDYLDVIVLCECLWIDYLVCAESIYVILQQRGLLLSKHFILVPAFVLNILLYIISICYMYLYIGNIDSAQSHPIY